MVSRPAQILGWIAKSIGRVIWVSTMVLVPLFGFWLASSLAAYHNASQWLSLLVGLALFPLLPLAWELFWLWRRKRRKTAETPILTWLDRMVLRTLIVNGVFLGWMMFAHTHDAFRAVAVRGDWMLDGFEGDFVTKTRHVLLTVADTFEHRWLEREATYGKSDAPPPTPTPTGTQAPGWPMDPAVDVQVKEIPEDSQKSIATVGKYLADRITEPRRLVKALHDYVDLRLTYDHKAAAAITAGDFMHAPPQDAESVFTARTAVCAGYANLLAALGKAAGVEIAYITGYARDSEQRTPENDDAALLATLQGYAHAWNAAHIGDEWLLIDATWDDPEDANAPPRSEYLMTPPELFGYQHLPDRENWQLLAKKLTPGDFVRQPLLTPIAGELGVVLVEPTRSQITVDGAVKIALANPRRAVIMADVGAEGSHDHGSPCSDVPLSDEHVVLTCKVGTGQFEIRLFGAAAAHPGDSLPYFGSIQVNAR